VIARGAAGRLTVFERADELPSHWSRVAAGGGLGLDARFLRSLEQSAVAPKRRYIVYDTASGAGVVAVADFLQRPAASNPVMSVLLGRYNSYLPSAIDWQLPLLVLRSDFGSDAPYSTSATTSPERGALLRAMLAELEAHADRQRWSLAVMGVPSGDRDMTRALQGRGYLRTLARPHATLQLADSWDGYLQGAARHSKNLVHNIRQEIGRARRDGVTIGEWNRTEPAETELCRLMAEHERRLSQRAWRFQPGLLERLSQSLGPALKVLVARTATGVQGTTVLAVSGRRGYVTFPGLVAESDRAGFTYFNLMYYEPIRLGISLGLESIEYGNGVYEAKIRRGCTVRANLLYVRPRNPFLRSLVRAPGALHHRSLQRKYAVFLQAAPFSNIRSRPHAHSDHERAS
jgi:predicted N-acyltransferase